jgi:hypothetical protein
MEMGKNEQKSYVCMYVYIHSHCVLRSPILVWMLAYPCASCFFCQPPCTPPVFRKTKMKKIPASQNADDSVCRLPPPYPCWTCTFRVPAVPRALDCVLLCVQLVCSACGPLRPTVWIAPAAWPLSAPLGVPCIASL